MAGILEGMDYIRDNWDRGRARAKESALSSLYSQAYSAPQEQRGGILAQIAGYDPQGAASLEGRFDQRQKDRQAATLDIARAWKASKGQPNRQALYESFLAPRARAAGLPVPAAYDEAMFDQEADALLAMAGPQSGLGVQSTYIDADGNRVAVLRNGQTAVLGQNAPNNQIIDTGNGFYGVNKSSLSAAPVQIGGGSPPAPQGQIPGVYIDPSLPPEVQAQIRQSETTGQPLPSQMYFGQGQQLRSAPKPQAPSDIERRLALAQGMGATPEEQRRMVIGGDSARDAQRISSKDATTARNKITQIKAARQQLDSAKQAFDKIRNSFSAGLGGNYLPTPEGQAFDRAIRNLAPLITAVTRVPGVGAMSDYESRLQEASLPSRGTYEDVTDQQFRDLENLLNTVEGGYNELLSGQSSQTSGGSSPNTGWSIQRVQ